MRFYCYMAVQLLTYFILTMKYDYTNIQIKLILKLTL